MRRHMAAAMVAMVIATAAAPLRAELVQATGQEPETGGMKVTPQQGPFHVQCWQYGQKIIDKNDVSDLALAAPGLTQGGIVFHPPGAGQRSQVYTPNPFTTCLVERQP